MGFSTFFILGLFLRIFQLFSFFSAFFHFFIKKIFVAFMGYGVVCHFFKSPHTITSGLLYSEDTLNLKRTSGLLRTQFPNLIKNYSQFSFFGGGHD